MLSIRAFFVSGVALEGAGAVLRGLPPVLHWHSTLLHRVFPRKLGVP